MSKYNNSLLAHRSKSFSFRPTPDQITAWVQANFDYKPRKGGRELCIDNPFDGDRGKNFNIDTIDGLCHDWRGDDWAGKYKPTFLRFVQIFRQCTFHQAVKEVCGDTLSLKALSLLMKREKQQEGQEEPKEAQQIELPKGSQRILESNQPLMSSILVKWLNSRGVDDEHIKIYDLYHQADNVVWPYYEYGELVYWQSRNRLNKIFRFPPESVGITKGMVLYGFDMVEPGDYCIVAEAIFGAHTLGEQCMASGGASLTQQQVRKIRALNPTKGVILAPDNDKAGIESIIHNYEMISPYFPVFYSIPPLIKYNDTETTKDWNELYTGPKMSLKEIRALFEKGVKRLRSIDMIMLMTQATLGGKH